jgi:hypothetical protein
MRRVPLHPTFATSFAWRTWVWVGLVQALPVTAPSQIQTKLPLSAITPGTEQIQLVPNGDFQQPGLQIGGLYPNPTGWARFGESYVGSGRNMVSADGGLVAEGFVGAMNPASGYYRSLTLQPATDYVLSAYMWNFGDLSNHVTTVVDLNDAPQEAQLTLYATDPAPDLGYFAYAAFNTATTGTNIIVRCFYDALTGLGASARYCPLGAQWDNIGITRADLFSVPTNNPQAQPVALPPTVVAWGDNSWGQTNVPPGLSGARAVGGGAGHSLALLANGAVVAWGENFDGQTNVPPELTNVTAIAAGWYHNLALESNGVVVGWGANDFGQAAVPAGLSNVIAVAAGGAHSLALRGNGTLAAWGFGNYGQTNVPPGLSNVVGIASGAYHNLALKSDGLVVAWGNNDYGQTNVPQDLSNVVSVAGGLYHSLALRSDGTVVGWGAGSTNVGYDHQFGQSVVSADLSNIVAIAAGWDHSLAIQGSNGMVLAWGDNSFGQTNVPTPFNGLVAIAAGGEHNLAIGYLNDWFTNIVPLAGTNLSFRCSNIGATNEVDESPDSPFDYQARHSIWYLWQAPADQPFGAVIEALSDTNFSTPALAVYAGDTLTSLPSNGVAINTSSFLRARVAFTTIPGQNYQIALDSGTPTGGVGTATISLKLTPPPVNDLFCNATIMEGDYFAASGSFLGASKEPGEPSHGYTNYEQTLWWTWTAPVINGTNTSQVLLTADAVSFPPAIAVYVGSALSNLTTWPIYHIEWPYTVPGVGTNRTMTTALFDAVAGTTYYIALAGRQHDPAGNVISARYGNYRLSLYNRTLALSLQSLSTNSIGPDAPVEFSASLNVQNLGPTYSAPLRVHVYALSELLIRGPDLGFVTNDEVLQGYWSVTTNSCAIQPLGLVSWWRAEVNANDSSGTNNGALLNGVSFAAGRVGQAFSFDGVSFDNAIQIGGNPLPPPWTAELWVNRQDSFDNSAILLGDTNTALKLEQFNNTRKVGFTQFGLADYVFNYIAPLGTWVHLAFVCTTSNIQLYVNGTLQDSQPATIALPLGEFGNDYAHRYNNRLRGLIDEITIYNRSLSPGEVSSIYTAGGVGKCLSASAGTLAPGQSATLYVTGVVPAPTVLYSADSDGTVSTFGLDYAVFFELQQQLTFHGVLGPPGGPDGWPTLNPIAGIPGNGWNSPGGLPLPGGSPGGTGGGTITLGPGYGNPGGSYSGQGNTATALSNVVIVGPETVPGGTSTNYLVAAKWVDGSIATANVGDWSAAPNSFPISTNGVFTPGPVATNTPVSISVPVAVLDSGITNKQTLSKNVIVLGVWPRFTAIRVLTNGTVALTLNQFPAHTNIIEAATNLAPPSIWTPLATNAPPNGVWDFFDPFRSNFVRRFYRGRER